MASMTVCCQLTESFTKPSPKEPIDVFSFDLCTTEYVEDRMGLTITSIWRLLVKDIEDTLDATCDQVRL